MQLRLLRWTLVASGIAWAASVFGIFLPWDAAERALVGLGAGAIPRDPMLEYWLRMAAGAFTFVGIWFFVMAARPRTHAAAIPWFGALMVAEGIVLLVSGTRLGLPPFPFAADTGVCLAGGVAILALSPHARSGS
ncbi:MAG: hypothetical protein DVB31_11815 [Verrucomicrobia bacterium]|nr:MAG: hypothetical protein DVB31_11815 [Verrucomicrobiota bacterium]